MKQTALVLAVYLSAFPAFAFTGRVAAVHDGDTVTVLTSEHRSYRVRLAYNDAPELDLPFGHRSTRALSNLVFGKTIEVEVSRDVRQSAAPVSADVRQKRSSIARPPQFNCEPLHLTTRYASCTHPA